MKDITFYPMVYANLSDCDIQFTGDKFV